LLITCRNYRLSESTGRVKRQLLYTTKSL